MDDNCYSNLLLDRASGIFNLESFLNAFIESAKKESLQYPVAAQKQLVARYNNYVQHLRQREGAYVESFKFPPRGSAGAAAAAAPAPAPPELEAVSDDEEEGSVPIHTTTNHVTASGPIQVIERPVNPAPSDATSLPLSDQEYSRVPPHQRLKLVLDLDNTLLHACSQVKLGTGVDVPLEDFVNPEGEPELFMFELPQMRQQLYYVKLRPGVRSFLREAARYCDLAIHTNATREYADVVVSILDPDGSLFGCRVAAREDETGKDLKKNMDRLFGVAELNINSLLILDDRKDVWDEVFQSNIIHCGMYDYLESRKKALAAKYGSGDSESMQEKSAPAAPTPYCLGVTGDSPNFLGAPNFGPQFSAAPAKVDTGAVASAGPSNSGFSRSEIVYPPPANTNDCGRTNSEDMQDDVPFLDNPLVAGSGAADTALVAGSSDNAECEDDDVIEAPEESGSSNANGDSNPSADAIVSGADTVTTDARHMSGVSELNEALIDYDTQLEAVKKLVVTLAQAYYRELFSHGMTLPSDNTDGKGPSIARLLTERRRNILQGVVVQTVGMFKSESSHPEHGWHDNGPMHRRRLVALGARVVETPDVDLTHLLAMRATQTIDRVRRERGDAVKYVHALWLHSCESNWAKVEESIFEALPLLKHYHYSPPRKPWVDHWRIFALATGICASRLEQAKRIESQGGGPNKASTLTDRAYREHLITRRQSHGSRIWSPTEEIFLKYDFNSDTLSQQLSSGVQNNLCQPYQKPSIAYQQHTSPPVALADAPVGAPHYSGTEVQTHSRQKDSIYFNSLGNAVPAATAAGPIVPPRQYYQQYHQDYNRSSYNVVDNYRGGSAEGPYQPHARFAKQPYLDTYSDESFPFMRRKRFRNDQD